MKRESGSNPEQPPLLYLTKERIFHWDFVLRRLRFCSPANHKSGDLPYLFRFSRNFGEKSAAEFIRYRMRYLDGVFFSFFVPFRALICCTFKIDSLYSFRNFGRSIFIFGGDFLITDEKKQWAICQLQEKFRELGRLPKKDDFDEPTRSRIKAFLGPWHRGLEAAGLREVSKKRKEKLKK